jgi:hypothetical protein
LLISKQKKQEKKCSLSRSYLNHDLVTMPCLLLSIKKKKKEVEQVDFIKNLKFDAKIIGQVDKIYTFQKIADFQYLPMCSNVVTKSNATTDGIIVSFLIAKISSLISILN